MRWALHEPRTQLKIQNIAGGDSRLDSHDQQAVILRENNEGMTRYASGQILEKQRCALQVARPAAGINGAAQHKRNIHAMKRTRCKLGKGH